MKKVEVYLYKDAIIAKLLNGPDRGMGFWQFVEKEYNGKQDWSWWHKKNCIKFQNDKDYMLFLLKIS